MNADDALTSVCFIFILFCLVFETRYLTGKEPTFLFTEVSTGPPFFLNHKQTHTHTPTITDVAQEFQRHV